MDATGRERTVAAGWFPRAIISGFVASAVMLFGFIIAYALAAVTAHALGATTRGGVLPTWLYALTHNSIIDLSVAFLYVGIAIYFVGGLLWALLYARFAEPYLPGPEWARGVLFSLVPAVVSIVVVLPLLGGGPFGLDIGAGPLPIVGNLVLHALYGVTLALIYGPFGSLSAEDFRPQSAEDARAMAAAERTAARATLAGLVVGAVAGVAILMIGGRDGATVLGVPPAAFMLATILGGATFGALIGSLAGVPSTSEREA